MAPGKKQKKAKSKRSKDSPSGLSHIASTLVPSAIFAAVPRTPTNLSQSWPRRTPSPIAQALGEAGNVGRVLIGDFSKRPPAELPASDEAGEGDRSRTPAAEHANEREERIGDDSEIEEVGYESVRDGKSFDKTTKYFRMSRGEDSSTAREEVEGVTANEENSSQQHFYHILDHEHGQVIEPVYSRVDKRRKSASKQSPEEKDEDSASEYMYSSDELTDVTSHDEESTTSGSRTRRRSRKSSRKEKHDGQESVDGPQSHRKRASTKKRTPDTIQEVSEDAAQGDSAVPPPIPPYLGDSSPEAPTRSRKRGQRSAQDQPDGPGEPLPPVPADPPENRLTDEQRRALKVVERLGFEGVSQKLALSDLSEDSESYMSPVVPKNTIDFNGRTTFEREQFNDTLMESNVPVSEAAIEEANLNLSHTFAGLNSFELQEELQSPNEQQDSNHPSFKTQARKANKVSSFVHLLNEQEKHRKTEVTAHVPTKGRRDPSPSSSRDSQGFNVDPALIQRLEEARQANEISFLERQRQLETLVEQQQHLYQEQLEQQRIQQQQQQEVVRQQWKLQEQLRALEKMQQEFNENADLSPRGPAVSESDVRLQRELVRQQQEFLQQQQGQLLHSQDQQARALEQQDKLCEQIRLLEEQQKQLQSSVSLLSPAGEDLAEIKQQEQQIVNLLNEQRRQDSELQRLHLLQQQRLDEQSNSFTHERKALKQNQEMLQGKIKEQETRRKQLEEELEEMARKHAESEEQWKTRISTVNMESTDGERKERLDPRDDQGKLNSSYYDKERMDARDDRVNINTSYYDKEGKTRHRPSDESSPRHRAADESSQRYRPSDESSPKHRAADEFSQRHRAADESSQRYRPSDESSPRHRAADESSQRHRAADESSQRYRAADESSQRNRASDESSQRHRPSDESSQRYRAADESSQRHRASDESSQRYRPSDESSQRHRPSDESSRFDEARHGHKSQSSDLSYRDEIEGRHSGNRRQGSDGSRRAVTEGKWRDERTESPRHGESGSRKGPEKTDRKTRRTRERNVEFETVIKKTDAAVTKVQVVRDDEVYRLSKGRIELLESEKSALMELNTSLQEENKALKQLALSLQKGTGVSSVVLQKQIKDLHQEQKVLRDAVHRLNVELSRYQAKYRPVSFEEIEGLALPHKKEAAPWLVNTKFLAPLFLAYDDRLKEKEQMIRTYDEELNAFKARVMEVVKENQQLHMSVSKSSPDALGPDEWQQLQQQAKLVVEENALLMEQQEIQDRKMKEMQRIHGQEVSKLSKRISSQESSQRRLETEQDDMRRTHSNLLRNHEAIVADQEHKMSVQEHLRIMDECRSVLEDLKAKTKFETDECTSRLQAIQKEKSNVAIKFADAEAKNAQLERELDAHKKSLKKSERKFLFLQRKLEHIQERELTAQETLSQVLTVAEKTAAERDNYVQFAKTQKVQQEKAASKIIAGTQNIKGLEDKLQEYRKKASDKVAVVTGRLREKEKEINKLKEQYEGEINNLRAMVRQKQRQLELMIGENRNVDKELELVWKTAAADNKRMQNTVRQKGGMFDSDSDPNAHLSSEEGEAA